jgi:hypothetical protein
LISEKRMACNAAALPLVVCLSALFDAGFFRSFLSNLFAVLVGAAIGVPIGLRLNRAAARHAQRLALLADREALSKATEATLLALRSAIDFNVSILKDLVRDLSNSQFVAFYDVDARTIGDLATGSASLLGPGLLAKLGRLRYELDHLSRLLRTQYELAFSSSGPSRTEMLSRDMIVQRIPAFSVELQSLCAETISMLDSALSQQSSWTTGK